MAKITKAQKSASTALAAAGSAAKQAKALSKSLSKKDSKKLLSLADEAKDASKVSKNKVATKPRKVEKKAVAAIGRLDKATDKIEKKLAADRKAAAKKSAANKKKPTSKKPVKKGSKPASVVVVKPVLTPAPTPIKAAAAVVVPATPAPLEPTVKVSPTRAARKPAAPKQATTTAPASADLTALTLVQLRDRARADGRAGFSRLNKAQLVALLSS